MYTILRLWVLCLLAVQAGWCLAHPPGLSSVELLATGDHLTAKITFSLQDIEAFAPMDSDLDAEVSQDEREAAKPAIASLVAEQLVVSAEDSVIAPQQPVMVSYDDQNNVHIDLQYLLQPKHKQAFSLQSRLLSRLPDGHQQFVSLNNDNGIKLTEKMLSRADDELVIATDTTNQANGTSSTFFDFFKLGVEHIVTGYDHLLFLFALLAVTHSFWPAFKIITFFTIAHSLTLAIASLNLVNLPSSLVEPLIAATIVYVALENILVSGQPKGRQWLTFSFGLVHGFGFASVLRELDIASGNSGILMPLFSFNLGIETGQIVIAAAVLPLIWQINKRLQAAVLFLRGISIFIALFGGYWFLERTLL